MSLQLGVIHMQLVSKANGFSPESQLTAWLNGFQYAASLPFHLSAYHSEDPSTLYGQRTYILAHAKLPWK